MVKKIEKQSIINLLKAILIAILIAISLILILSLFVNIFNLSTGVIRPINQVIKIVSLAFACFIGITKKEKGLIKGCLIGLLLTFVFYLVFSILSFSFQIELSFLIECIFMGVIGGVLGIIAVNIRK